MIGRGSDVAIIGAGIMGVAAAWRLAKRGARVTLFEQFDLAHTRGSSHGASRIFRLAYDVPDYVQLAAQALPLWREAEEELGVEMLRTTGGLDLGPPDELHPIARALTSGGIDIEHLTHSDLAQRFPTFVLPAGWEGLYARDTGVLRADLCRSGFLQLARSAGVKVVESTRVTQLRPEGNGVTLMTDTARWNAEYAVVTAAGWSNQLLEPLGYTVPIRTTLEHVAYYPWSKPFPPFIWHDPDAPFEFYGLPNGDRSEVKLGEHGAGAPIDPNLQSVVDDNRLHQIRHFVENHLPALGTAPMRSETCLYAATPDDDFVIDREGPLLICVGFGGHGFKFAPKVGDIVADLVHDNAIEAHVRFSRARFNAATGG